jgi:hypothetical protein
VERDVASITVSMLRQALFPELKLIVTEGNSRRAARVEKEARTGGRSMKRILFAASALAIAAVVTPASAQVWVGAEPGGVGVQVGPVGIGVGPDYWGYRDAYWHDYDGPDCRVVRERIVTRHGHEIIRSHRVCG